MRRPLEWFRLSLVLALLLGSDSAAAQRSPPLEGGEFDRMRGERRIALVIGNGGYGPRIGPLANPTNDARDVAAALGGLGFEVALELDADRDRMRRAVIDFGRSLRDGGIGLFYFSGHAVQLDGLNYMIPLGAEVESEDYVPVETVDVNDVLARMGSAENRLNIVILDACRNNPFKGIFRAVTRGLAQTRSPTGTFIAYAAAPGELALDGKGTRNSPYTKALLETLEEPGLDLEDVFKRVRGEVLERTDRFQTPWTGSSIIGDFYFRLPEPAPQVVSPTPAPPASAPMIDVMVWAEIKDSQDPKDFETFFDAYPDSPFAPFARNRAKALQAAREAASPPPAEPAPDASTIGPSAAAIGPAPTAGPPVPTPAAKPEPTTPTPSIAALSPAATPATPERDPAPPEPDPEAAAVLAPTSPAVPADTRVALVVGNATYTHAPALTNSRNDAAGMAAALRRLGFAVEEAVDLDARETEAALRRFSRLLEDADVGLFYYAGHGLRFTARITSCRWTRRSSANPTCSSTPWSSTPCCGCSRSGRVPASSSSMPAATTRSRATSPAAWGHRARFPSGAGSPRCKAASAP